MKTLEDIFAIFRTQEEELAQRGVKNLAIFGSFARGEETSASDVDILVVFNRPVGLFEFVRLKMLLEEWLGRQVDLVTPDALHPMLRERILAEAIYVHEETRA
jgi:predicted nucleotidyltransferase